jgi:two-component system sensor histidine kinase EvgS
LINQLLSALAVTNRSDRQALLKAHASGSQHELHTLAHRIKGGALMVRADGLIQCCQALEQACGSGETALVNAAVDQLQQAMTRLDQYLASV